MRTCPDCKSTVSEQAKFCDTCGYPLEQESPLVSSSSEKSGDVSYGTCSACGYPNIAGETFCQQCGVQLPPVMSSPPPPPTPVQPQKLAYKAGWHSPDDLSNNLPPPENCLDCGFMLNPGDKFCPNCGYDLHKIPKTPEVSSVPVPPVEPADEQPSPGTQEPVSDKPIECPSCGFTSTSGDVFCPVCGYRLNLSSAIEPQQPVEDETPDLIEQNQVESHPVGPESQQSKACPVCSWEYSELVDTYCPNCGQFLGPEAETPAAPGDEKATITLHDLPGTEGYAVETEPEPAEISGRLVIGYSNQEIILPPGRTNILIGRSDPERDIFPEIDLTPFGGEVGGVSRKHVLLTVQGTQIYVQDLNSTNYTFINKTKLEPETQYPLNDGDEIRIGGLILHYFME